MVILKCGTTSIVMDHHKMHFTKLNSARASLRQWNGQDTELRWTKVGSLAKRLSPSNEHALIVVFLLTAADVGRFFEFNCMSHSATNKLSCVRIERVRRGQSMTFIADERLYMCVWMHFVDGSWHTMLQCARSQQTQIAILLPILSNKTRAIV